MCHAAGSSPAWQQHETDTPNAAEYTTPGAGIVSARHYEDGAARPNGLPLLPSAQGTCQPCRLNDCRVLHLLKHHISWNYNLGDDGGIIMTQWKLPAATDIVWHWLVQGRVRWTMMCGRCGALAAWQAAQVALAAPPTHRAGNPTSPTRRSPSRPPLKVSTQLLTLSFPRVQTSLVQRCAQGML